jgi:hypothetical protein
MTHHADAIHHAHCIRPRRPTASEFAVKNPYPAANPKNSKNHEPKPRPRRLIEKYSRYDIGYLDARNKSPKEIVQVLLKKVRERQRGTTRGPAKGQTAHAAIDPDANATPLYRLGMVGAIEVALSQQTDNPANAKPAKIRVALPPENPHLR